MVSDMNWSPVSAVMSRLFRDANTRDDGVACHILDHGLGAESFCSRQMSIV